VAALSFLVLGVCGIVNTVFLFWVLLALTLQRGPVAPCEDELSPPPPGLRAACLAALALPLLVLLPYPSFQVDPTSLLAPF
jgi:hypothetical protein